MRTATLLLVLQLPFMVASAQNVKQADDIIVLPMSVQAPAVAKSITTISVGNNGSKLHCDYQQLIMEVKKKTLAAGGNLAKITELADPYFISSCYRIKATVYNAPNITGYKRAAKTTNKNISATLPDTANYALLYIYRLKDTAAFEPSYHLHMNADSVIGDVKSRSHYELRLDKSGTYNFWAETEGKQSINVYVQQGKVYFLRCGTHMGDLRRVADLQLVTSGEGVKEYRSLVSQKRESNDNYLDQIH